MGRGVLGSARRWALALPLILGVFWVGFLVGSRSQQRNETEHAQTPSGCPPLPNERPVALASLAAPICLDDHLPAAKGLGTWSCHGGENQLFMYSVVNHTLSRGKKCLQGGSVPGSIVVLRDCVEAERPRTNNKKDSTFNNGNGTDFLPEHQKWIMGTPNAHFGGYTQIRNQNGLCLTLGFPPSLQLCRDECDQYWKVISQVSELSEVPKSLPSKPAHIAGKLFCFVVTYPKNHHDRVPAIMNTWLSSCDYYAFVSSNHTGFNTVITDLPASDGRDSLWKKTMDGWIYAYNNFIDKADWFLKADDDAFIYTLALRHYLSDLDPLEPHYLGRRFRYGDREYHSGGASYVLSKAALQKLAPQTKASFSTFCDVEDSEFGRNMARVGVRPSDTRDSYGLQRFHPFNWNDMHNLNRENSPDVWLWKIDFYPTLFDQMCCSKQSVSYHYVETKDLYLMNLCPTSKSALAYDTFHVPDFSQSKPSPMRPDLLLTAKDLEKIYDPEDFSLSKNWEDTALIANLASGMCLDNFLEEKGIGMYECLGTDPQIWLLVDIETIQIQGKCLEASSSINGLVALAECDEKAELQRWKVSSIIEAWHQLSSGGLCLDALSYPVRMQTCRPHCSQYWRFGRTHYDLLRVQSLPSAQSNPAVRLVCLVVFPDATERGRLPFLRASWLPGCDFEIFATASRDAMGSHARNVSLSTLRTDGLLVRDTLLDAQRGYFNEVKEKADWLLRVDHRSYVYIDRLKRYLSVKNPDQTLLLGRKDEQGLGVMKDELLSSRYGYILSRGVMKKLKFESWDLLFTRSERIDDGGMIESSILHQKLPFEIQNPTDEHGCALLHAANYEETHQKVNGENQFENCFSLNSLIYHDVSDSEILFQHRCATIFP